MPRLYILSAFSLNMIPHQGWIHLFLKEVKPEEARRIIEEAEKRGKQIVSAVGHTSTAELLSKLLGFRIPMCRAMVTFEDGDEAIVLQLMVRLQEGQVLSEHELQQLLQEGKIKLLHIMVSTKFW